MTDAIVFDDVVKTYGRLRALDGLSLAIPQGKLTGYVGPNGAGKTTSFRALLGLTRLNSGAMSVLGMQCGPETAAIVKRVGAVVEEPGLHKGLSAIDNMRVTALTLGRGHEAIDDLLDFVTLGEVAGKKVKGFSKGMRQRLALAQAMIGEPEILILDEPLDGLDPAGQALLKHKLRSLVEADGLTVVVSSHNLADIEEMADHVAVIDRGRLIAAGSIDEVIGLDAVLLVRIADLQAALLALTHAGFECEIEDGLLAVVTEDGAEVAEALAARSLYPSMMTPRRNTLEGRFLELTEGGFGS